MLNNNLALTESVSLRNQNLKEFSDEKAINTLNKAKSLVMAVWEGKNIAITEQIAEFYAVPINTVQSAIKNNRSEFESDGLRLIKGKELIELKAMSLIDITLETSSLIIWTPRAALRLGMILRDSLVAKNIRDLVLDLVETIPQNTPILLPQRDTIAYIEAASIIPTLQVNPQLKQLLEDALTDDLELSRNIKALPNIINKKEYTIVKVRAKELGYDIDKIANGSELGKYVAKHIKYSFKKNIGDWNVNHYEINPKLDQVIKSFFSK
jgi:hypothetical protein